RAAPGAGVLGAPGDRAAHRAAGPVRGGLVRRGGRRGQRTTTRRVGTVAVSSASISSRARARAKVSRTGAHDLRLGEAGARHGAADLLLVHQVLGALPGDGEPARSGAGNGPSRGGPEVL